MQHGKMTSLMRDLTESSLKMVLHSFLTLLSFLAVDDGSIIDVNFSEFVYHAPEGFQKIMFEKNLL